MKLEIQNVSEETLCDVATALSDGVQVLHEIIRVSREQGLNEVAEDMHEQIKRVLDFRQIIIDTLKEES